MIVGLTGGIGSGKSTVAAMFSLLGIPVYSSDERAKALYYNAAVKLKILDILGTKAYNAEGKLDRAYVSEKIFKDKELLSRVNAVIHPAVGEDFKSFVEAHSSAKVIIKETALLFEAGIRNQVEKVILVTSPLELRVRRLQERDNSTRQQILDRMNNQVSDEEKTAQSDFIVVNDEEQAVIPQVLDIYRRLNA